MNKEVVTRFAPSPTGFLHIGGARTALFNWLYAKSQNGKMLLRIEDTDRARSNDEAVAAIIDGMKWLGLDWEGDPISQFSRLDRHKEIANKMLAEGKAYRCYCTPEELSEMRDRARAEGRNPMYDGTWRDRGSDDWPDDLPFAVRIKTPLDGETVIQDRVQGEVHFKNQELDDFVLLRSDGTPTYMLAVVVDDHDMNVSHIIRGDDHLTNAAKQVLIYNALGWAVPEMAHIPLIHGSDGAKLSKRHGAIGAETYRAMGYLPEALRNYLVRLGWSHGDDEIISTGQMIEWFDFDGMKKSAARFDYDKLDAINAHYLRTMSPSDLVVAMLDLLPELDDGEAILSAMNGEKKEWLEAAMPALAERSKTLVELVANASFIFDERPLKMEDKANSLVTGEGKEVLSLVVSTLDSLDDWTHEGIAGALKGFCERNDLKLGKVAQPIRAALTGKNSSPGAFDVLLALGKNEALARISDRL